MSFASTNALNARHAINQIGFEKITGANEKDVEDLIAFMEGVQSTALDAYVGINTAYMLISAMLVFVMQIGFAMLCAGSVRSKNTMSILLKNVLDAALGALAWYLTGYGIAFGPTITTEFNAENNEKFRLSDNQAKTASEFVGHSLFAAHQLEHMSLMGGSGASGYAQWFFQWAFAATAATIVSGAIAERASFVSYLGYSVLLTGFVYPFIVHWCWSADGWLSPWNYRSATNRGPRISHGCIDFAGCGVVHMVGGVAALVAAFFVGPRIGRFDADGKPNLMPGHSATLITLGTFLLWFGWYGFNPGSNLIITGYYNATTTARVALTTTLGAGAGGCSFLALYYFTTGQLGLIDCCNGVLCGLVSITAGCATVRPWAAIIAGIVAAPVFMGGSAMVKKMRIDDVVDAFAMHACCGAWGLVFTGFLSSPELVEWVYAIAPSEKFYGCFFPGSNGGLLAANLIEIVVIIAWVGSLIGAFFFICSKLGLARVAENVEMIGLDVSKHGGLAYNGPQDGVPMMKATDNFLKDRPAV